MPIECPHCAAVYEGPLSTHGLPFRRCPTCQRFFDAPSFDTASEEAREVGGGSRVAEWTGHASSVGVITPPVAIAPEPITQTPLPPRPRRALRSSRWTSGGPLGNGQDAFVVPGYQIQSVLGRGGMGTVYLARQLSLDRLVALKVMGHSWANDPTFVARFTREAYAAAQLNHPNLVQVYDIGEVDGTKYFSMEYVAGRSIADMIRLNGKFDPETAVSYALQAARALEHAHRRGMIHRDIKPDNLLVDPHGLVKVADLGLVKTPDLSREADRVDSDAGSQSGLHTIPPDMTGYRMALGTPAYMSPEQCRDAAAVDHRADIYSLGCTLYAMVTGQQPFDGQSAVQLMTAHAYKPLVPPEEVSSRVPKELSLIIQRMMAKQPADRYQSMGEVVRALEHWLGVPQVTTSVGAREEYIAALEDLVHRYNTAPTALLRTRILTGFTTTILIAAVVLLFLGHITWAFGVASLVLQTGAIYFVANGMTRRTYLFSRVRQVVSGLSLGDWLVAAGLLMLFGISLWTLKLFTVWLGFGLIAFALAIAIQVGLDRPLELERRPILNGCERLLRQLRTNGRDEQQIRLFVAKYGGRYWEELFEELFGYEAKLAIRAQLLRGESAGERERFAEWREPIVVLIDRIEKQRQSVRERELLARTEQERLQASGMPLREARRQAERRAAAMVRQADLLRKAESRRQAGILSNPEMGNTQLVFQQLRTGAAAPEERWAVSDWLAFAVLGPHVRGLLATVLLAACAVWTVQNQLWNFPDQLAPLVVPGLPASYTAWCEIPNVGLAGILLLTSLFYRGHRMSIIVMTGALLTIVAHEITTIPSVPPISDAVVGAMVGTVLALVGYRFGSR